MENDWILWYFTVKIDATLLLEEVGVLDCGA